MSNLAIGDRFHSEITGDLKKKIIIIKGTLITALSFYCINLLHVLDIDTHFAKFQIKPTATSISRE